MASGVASREKQAALNGDHLDEKDQWQTQDMSAVQDVGGLEAARSNGRSIKARRSIKNEETLIDLLRSTILQHQLGLSINCILLLFLTHVVFPRLRPTTAQFFTFSYHDPETGLYNPGLDDLKFVAFALAVLMGLRAGIMDYVLIPYAKWMGIGKRKATIRFAEQAWLVVYYLIFWPVGVYLVYTSDYMLDFSELWTNWPTKSMTGLAKWYYLSQFAFYTQQIVVVNIEDRRSDYWQMFMHHIITCALMLASYGCYQTRVGTLFLVLMDVVDLLLPTAKMLRYCGFQTACDVTFGIFIVTWFMARHVLYLAVCWSVYKDLPAEISYGCYDVNTGVRTGDANDFNMLGNVLHAFTSDDIPVCWNQRVTSGFLAGLLVLQGITILWFCMICRVAYGVLSGKAAEDSRSDDEGDDEDGEEEEEDVDDLHPIDQIRDFPEKTPELQMKEQPSTQPAQDAPYEEEVGVEELHFVRRSSPKKGARMSKSRASGISLPGDHKELLGRIGCDKPS